MCMHAKGLSVQWVQVQPACHMVMLAGPSMRQGADSSCVPDQAR